MRGGVLGVLAALGVILEFNFDLFSIEGALIIVLDTLSGGCMVLHLRKCEAIFRVSVPLGHDTLNGTVFLKQSPEFIFKFLGFRLDMMGSTFPSRLVMKSLLVCCLSSDRDLSLSLRFPLDELDYDIISLLAIQIELMVNNEEKYGEDIEINYYGLGWQEVEK